jgi:hypothetical protein
MIRTIVIISAFIMASINSNAETIISKNIHHHPVTKIDNTEVVINFNYCKESGEKYSENENTSSDNFGDNFLNVVSDSKLLSGSKISYYENSSAKSNCSRPLNNAYKAKTNYNTSRSKRN